MGLCGTLAPPSPTAHFYHLLSGGWDSSAFWLTVASTPQALCSLKVNSSCISCWSLLGPDKKRLGSSGERRESSGGRGGGGSGLGSGGAVVYVGAVVGGGISGRRSGKAGKAVVGGGGAGVQA